MISSKADFFFFSPPLESELESFLFTEVEDEDDAALSALAPRTELDLEGPATEEQAPKLKATFFFLTLPFELCVDWSFISALAFTAFADLLLDHSGTPLLVVKLLFLLSRLLLLASDGLWVAVDVLDVPAFGGFINFAKTLSAQPLGEVGQSLPLRGVHMDVLPVTDVLIVDDVVVYSLGPKSSPEQLQEVTFEFI